MLGTAVVTSNACLAQLFVVKKAREIKKKIQTEPQHKEQNSNIIRNSKVLSFLILKSLPHLKEKTFFWKKNEGKAEGQKSRKEKPLTPVCLRGFLQDVDFEGALSQPANHNKMQGIDSSCYVLRARRDIELFLGHLDNDV